MAATSDPLTAHVHPGRLSDCPTCPTLFTAIVPGLSRIMKRDADSAAIFNAA